MNKIGYAFCMVLLATAMGCSEEEESGVGGESSSDELIVRDGRYCEVLLGFVENSRVQADVYNTWGLNDCPQEAWDALDLAQIQESHGAVLAMLNGPRHWMMDEFVDSTRADNDPVSFGGLEMALAGILEVSPGTTQDRQPYVENTVNRNTTYAFWAGNKVYELVNPAGQVFVMQSYSLQVDPTLTEASLSELGARLELPEGWSYRARDLEEDLYVTAIDDKATVVTDDLQNTYQLSQQ